MAKYITLYGYQITASLYHPISCFLSGCSWHITGSDFDMSPCWIFTPCVMTWYSKTATVSYGFCNVAINTVHSYMANVVYRYLKNNKMPNIYRLLSYNNENRTLEKRYSKVLYINHKVVVFPSLGSVFYLSHNSKNNCCWFVGKLFSLKDKKDKQ